MERPPASSPASNAAPSSLPIDPVAHLTVNGRAVDARPGEMLLGALQRAGIRVPTLCALPDLVPGGACRLCVVEVEGQRGLVPSCAFPVRDGLVVQTHSRRAVDARRTLVELLLSGHPDDCLYCPRNGQCRLQELAAELGVRERRFPGAARHDEKLDASSPSIVRDPSKCILCGRCVRVCHEVQTVGAIDFIGRGCATRVGPALDRGLNVSSCIHCGQCVVVCPTGALTEKSHVKAVLEALSDPSRVVVVQHAPAVSVTLARTLGLRAGQDAAGRLHAALRKVGFAKVFDTSFTADLTVLEEASELVARIRDPGHGPLPMFTSCSPGWVRFVEQEYPDLVPHLSTCKSPQQMLGALLKGWWAAREGVDPRSLYVVSVMPCTAKKFEAGRPEMGRDGLSDVDAVLTTRELLQLLTARGLDLADLPEEEADDPFGARSGAGKLFGSTGGVMEAALRSAGWLLTGTDGEVRTSALRGQAGRREAHVQVGGHTLGVAVVSGLGQARRLLEEIRAGTRHDLHFVEVMTCPGGCVAGGGQPYELDLLEAAARRETLQRSLYQVDRAAPVRTAHANPSVVRLYAEVLGVPLGAESHRLLHTSYHPRRRP